MLRIAIITGMDLVLADMTSFLKTLGHPLDQIILGYFNTVLASRLLNLRIPKLHSYLLEFENIAQRWLPLFQNDPIAGGAIVVIQLFGTEVEGESYVKMGESGAFSLLGPKALDSYCNGNTGYTI